MTELGKLLINEGVEKGKKKKTIEIVQEAIAMELEDECVIKLTGLTQGELDFLKKMM